jgi:hypothetical protein
MIQEKINECWTMKYESTHKTKIYGIKKSLMNYSAWWNSDFNLRTNIALVNQQDVSIFISTIHFFSIALTIIHINMIFSVKKEQSSSLNNFLLYKFNPFIIYLLILLVNIMSCVGYNQRILIHRRQTTEFICLYIHKKKKCSCIIHSYSYQTTQLVKTNYDIFVSIFIYPASYYPLRSIYYGKYQFIPWLIICRFF